MLFLCMWTFQEPDHCNLFDIFLADDVNPSVEPEYETETNIFFSFVLIFKGVQRCQASDEKATGLQKISIMCQTLD